MGVVELAAIRLRLCGVVERKWTLSSPIGLLAVDLYIDISGDPPLSQTKSLGPLSAPPSPIAKLFRAEFHMAMTEVHWALLMPLNIDIYLSEVQSQREIA